SQSVVNCLFQDSQGFMWIGTQNGLNRFDGENFRIYRYLPNDSLSLSNNWIYAISEDRQGNLWIGTKGGLNKYLHERDCFERISYSTGYDPEVSTYSYNNLLLSDRQMLVHTPPVISVFEPGAKHFIHYKSDIPFDPSIKDLKLPVLEDQDEILWLGCTQGIAVFSLQDEEFKCYPFLSGSGDTLQQQDVTELFQDASSRIWAGTTEGLFLFNREDECFETKVFTLTSGEVFSFATCIRSIVETKSGDLIVGTEGNGIFILTEVYEERYSIENLTSENSGLAHNIVQSLLIDNSENLWVGTLAGISKTDLKRNKFRLYRNSNSPSSVDLLGNVIAGMLKNDDGKLWIGNWGQGLNIVDPESNKVEHFSTQQSGNHYLPNDFVHVVFKDKESNIWLGTRDGIFIWNQQNKRFEDWRQFFDRPDWPAFDDTRIYHIIQDKNNRFWIGTSVGVYLIDKRSDEIIRFDQQKEGARKIGSNLVYTLLEDADGLIWMATIGGLDVFNPTTNKLIHYNKAEGELSSNFVISLCEDSLRRIWIGTNAAINIFDKKTQQFSYLNEKDGLPSNYIYEIVEDKNHDLWFSTGNGLCKYNLDKNEIQVFTPEDGLQSSEFNLRAAFCADDGELLFGGMNGFNTFYPDSLKGNPYVPNIVFTAFTTSSNDEQHEINIATESKVVLKHDVQSFTIEFAALEFTNANKNTYAYKMEGISNEWIEIANRKFVPFFALPAGEYTFSVRGANNDGVWNQEGASVQLVVLPQWWRSNYAYLAYFVLIVLGIWTLVKLRERRLQLEKVRLEKKVLERTIQIKEQNEVITAKNKELNALNRTKDKFFSIIGHDLRNHFNIIIGFSENLLMDFKSMDAVKQEYHISNIHKSSIQANDLLGNLLTWARLQRNSIAFNPERVNVTEKIMELLRFHEEAALKKNILIDVYAKEEVYANADLNMFSTIIRNLLANAIKFTHDDGEIAVYVKRENNWCSITIKDNGIGISANKLQKIFSMESTEVSRGTKGEKGTGLGLVLCKEFVEKHGGEISLKSKPGVGSEFSFTLPVND
ncbi:MAG TPA: two-component regulator propeller domain-containing protein, partial [Draconibacterium sp.]|nr:two-component regulator propeller domain-containing protein [Draconibacterium sp.]